MTKLDDFNELAGTDLSSEEYDSVGGFIIELLDRLPETGDQVILPGLTFTVEKIDKNRIKTIHVLLSDSEEIEPVEEIKQEIV